MFIDMKALSLKLLILVSCPVLATMLSFERVAELPNMSGATYSFLGDADGNDVIDVVYQGIHDQVTFIFIEITEDWSVSQEFEMTDIYLSSVGDIDRDGKPDVSGQIPGGYNDDLVIIESIDYSSYPSSQIYASGWFTSYYYPVIRTNIDDDGYDELAMGIFSPQVFQFQGLWILEAWGDDQFHTAAMIPSFFSDYAPKGGVVLGDWDGDGYKEIAMGGFDTLEVFEIYPDWSYITVLAVDRDDDTDCVLKADTDGNGQEELIILTDRLEGLFVEIYRSDADNHLSLDTSFHAGPASLTVTGTIGDFDGDGRDEILTCPMHYPPRIYKNLGYDNFACVWEAPAGWCDSWLSGHPLSYDFDGDNRDEIVWIVVNSECPSYVLSISLPSLGVELQMPDSYFTAGEVCWLKAVLHNNRETLSDVPLFILLDVYGEYWFWPEWTTEPDYSLESVPEGRTEKMIVPVFFWPDIGSAALDGIFFYAAMTNTEFSQILGGDAGIGQWVFGYGSE